MTYFYVKTKHMTKIELFPQELQQQAAFHKAFGHPARLAILKFLSDTKNCITGDICNELPLSRTTVNQHLSELKELNLIKGEINGAKTNYCLNTQGLEKVKQEMSVFLNNLDTSSSGC
ncbi:ArsR family transcriptional regulator [bacterium]|nr:ArsR family transcriptional regulator [bacterium]